MRIFWSFMALILLVATILLLTPAEQVEKIGRTLQAALRNEPAIIEAVAAPVVEKAADVEYDEAASSGDETDDDDPQASEDAAPTMTAGDDAAGTHGTTMIEPPSAPATTPPAAASATETASTMTATKSSSTDDAAPDTTTDAAGGASAPKSDEVMASDDDRFTIKGAGTRDDPYRITWELLTSAYETYRPREGKDQVPPRIQNLHDKHVRITGYLAFPMLVGEVEEALVMLNPWDGCCVGVPPTPYDSIEATLSEPIMAERDAYTPYGVVDGTLKIDPYIVNGWLVGLYIVEGARVQLLN